MADLPDYYLGRLIIHDEDSADNMRWIVYDGLTQVRCVSKTAAMKYIQEHALKVNDDALHYLYIEHDRLRRSYMHLDDIAAMLPAADRLTIEAISVNLRKIADSLDTYLAQQVPTRLSSNKTNKP